MTDFETFDAARAQELAAEGEWVAVVLLDDSDASSDWEKMLGDEVVAPAFDNYTAFLLRLEATPQEASEAMELWEVDQLPALVVLDAAGMPFDSAYLAADSVESPEDFLEYLEEHASSLEVEVEEEEAGDEGEWPDEDDL